MTFEGVLQDILKSLILTSEDRQSYTQDADEIRDYILRKMKEKDEDFRRSFIGASLTGSYLDDLKIEKPDEFDIHIKLQLPHKLTLQETSKPRGCFRLYYERKNIPQKKIKHPITHISEGHFIGRKKLQAWIRNILELIFLDSELNLLLVSGRTYRIEYSKYLRGYAVAHTIFAEDVSDKNRKISFDFVPAIEFDEADWISKKPFNSSDSPWFAVPSPKNKGCAFMICAPHLERALLSDKMNLKNSLRLFKAIRDNNEMPHLTSYLIKTVYLWENERHRHCDNFWKQSMGALLINMMECLIKSLRTGHISFYWQSDLNLLDRLDGGEIRDYRQKLQTILHKLISYRNGTLSLAEMAKVFGC